MTDAVDVLANSIRMNPRTFGAGRLAELYIQGLQRAGYAIVRACTYPNCECPVAFPEGYKPSEETGCPRAEVGCK